MTREPIYQALFALMQSIVWDTDQQLKETSRRVKMFSDVPKSMQPAGYQGEHGEVSGQTSNTPYKRVFKASWLFYFDAEPKSLIPASFMNKLLDAVEVALAVQVTDPGYFDERNTLHGLVYHCFIDGEILKEPGDIDGQALTLVPIKILVP